MNRLKITAVVFLLFATPFSRADVIDSFDELRPTPQKPVQIKLEKKVIKIPESVTDVESAALRLSDKRKQTRAIKKFEKCKIKFWTKGARLDRKAFFLDLPNRVRIEKCDLKMTASRAKLIYGKNMREIIRVEASGNVQIEKRDAWTGLPMKAKARSLVYDNANHKVEMFGKPASLSRGDAEEFASKRIEYDIVRDVIQTDEAEGELGNP